jgi:hypothetical protein
MTAAETMADCSSEAWSSLMTALGAGAVCSSKLSMDKEEVAAGKNYAKK